MRSSGCFRENIPVLTIQRAGEGRRKREGSDSCMARPANHVLVFLSAQGQHLGPHELYKAKLVSCPMDFVPTQVVSPFVCIDLVSNAQVFLQVPNTKLRAGVQW